MSRADAEQAGDEQGVVLGLLAVVAALMTFSLGRFLVSGRPSMVDGWYARPQAVDLRDPGRRAALAAYVLM